MLPVDPAELNRKLAELRLEHRDLDTAIANLQANIASDELTIKRLKKRKLLLKDQIARLEPALIPDEPAGGARARRPAGGSGRRVGPGGFGAALLDRVRRLAAEDGLGVLGPALQALVEHQLAVLVELDAPEFAQLLDEAADQAPVEELRRRGRLQ